MPETRPKLYRVYVFDRYKDDRIKQVYRYADSRGEAMDDVPLSFAHLIRNPSCFVMAEEAADA